jgi:hypothetical protein
MKRFTPHALLIILISFVSGAWADHPRWQHRERKVIKLEIHSGYARHGHSGGGYRHGHGGHRHGHGSSDWTPWATAALLGSTLYWTHLQAQPAVTTVIVSPPVVYSPPRVAYFCQTSQQYYPVVPVCQVPWQTVSY